jgi:uncharacterized membrane protein (Fun14 family)
MRAPRVLVSASKGNSASYRISSTIALTGGAAYWVILQNRSTCQPGDKEAAENSEFKPGSAGNSSDPSASDRDDKKVDKFVDAALTVASKAILHLGVSGVLGVFSGYAVKRLGKEAMFVGGSIFVFAQSLAFVGWISIHYSKIFKDVGRLLLDADGDGKVDFNDLKILFRKGFYALTVGLPVIYEHQVYNIVNAN